VYTLSDNDEWIRLGNELNVGSENSAFDGLFVSLSADGRRLAVSDKNEDRVRVLSLQSNMEWIPLGGDIIGEANGDDFGVSVDLSADATILAVGANMNDANGTNSRNNNGHARVFSIPQSCISGATTEPPNYVDGEDDEPSGVVDDNGALSSVAVIAISVAAPSLIVALIVGGMIVFKYRSRQEAIAIVHSDDVVAVEVVPPSESTIAVVEVISDNATSDRILEYKDQVRPSTSVHHKRAKELCEI